MFGNLTHLMHTGSAAEPPKDVPPPTPVNFPRCFPQDPVITSDQPAPKPLNSVLQGIIRPNEISISHLEALGTRVIYDSEPADLIPDPSYIPDFDAWHALSADDAHNTNESTRVRLNTGNLSPGCQTYLDRMRELSIPNAAAYRTVRRMPTVKGQPQARLGNSFEFFRHLELFSTYWDDTSKPASPKPKQDEAAGDKDSTDSTGNNASVKPDVEAGPFWRTGTGHQMPPEYRQNILTAFLKLVAYDYGCNVSAPRTEPRLYITSNPPPDAPPSASPKKSYFSSGCTFVFRTPTTREAARSGIVEGPLVAVSARHTTSFPPSRPAPSVPTSPSATSSSLALSESATSTPALPTKVGADRDSTIDLAREIVAALITAQHRAREGKTEKRIGEGTWWTTKPRWGGGPGGPIGREVEMQSGDDVVGDKDEPPSSSSTTESSSQEKPASSIPGGNGLSLPRRPGSGSSSSSRSLWTGLPSSSGGAKGAKRLKKSGNLAIYDSYRMVRPPAAAWDKKTKYAAIGRARGADYDDIFVVSALFHHISVVRVRVPDRLLAVLEGEREDPASAAMSWGLLEVRRSKWYDLFKADDRIAAMQLLWSMMAYLMREDPVEEEKKAKDGGKGEGEGEGKGEGKGEGEGEKKVEAKGPSDSKSEVVAEVAAVAQETTSTEETSTEEKDGQGDVQMGNS